MRFVKESLIPASVDTVFGFYARPEVFERLQPSDAPIEFVNLPDRLNIGSRIEARLHTGLVCLSATIELVAAEPNRSLSYRMIQGPFPSWFHSQRFTARRGGCTLRDEIDYQPPPGLLSLLLTPESAQRRLERLFEYRHQVTLREVAVAR